MTQLGTNICISLTLFLSSVVFATGPNQFNCEVAWSEKPEGFLPVTEVIVTSKNTDNSLVQFHFDSNGARQSEGNEDTAFRVGVMRDGNQLQVRVISYPNKRRLPEISVTLQSTQSNTTPQANTQENGLTAFTIDPNADYQITVAKTRDG